MKYNILLAQLKYASFSGIWWLIFFWTYSKQFKINCKDFILFIPTDAETLLKILLLLEIGISCSFFGKLSNISRATQKTFKFMQWNDFSGHDCVCALVVSCLNVCLCSLMKFQKFHHISKIPETDMCFWPFWATLIFVWYYYYVCLYISVPLSLLLTIHFAS